MEALDFWKLCDRVTVFQAIVLTIGLDPGNLRSKDVEGERWHRERQEKSPDGYGAVKTALLTAIQNGDLKGVTVCELRDTDINGNDNGSLPGTVDIDGTYIPTAAIRQFLKERNFQSAFFTPHEDPSMPGYLDPAHPCYATKLAAAVDAWTVVTTEGKYETESTPKQLMEKWLRINAVRYGLNKPDGKLNEDGISQITKIANWKPEGGAARTPGSKNPTTPRKAPKTH
jgi:hypothetical protein